MARRSSSKTIRTALAAVALLLGLVILLLVISADPHALEDEEPALGMQEGG